MLGSSMKVHSDGGVFVSTQTQHFSVPLCQLLKDAWLLHMGTSSWSWQQLRVENEEHGAPELWCHPACRVRLGVVLSLSLPHMFHHHTLLLLFLTSCTPHPPFFMFCLFLSLSLLHHLHLYTNICTSLLHPPVLSV